MPNNAASSLLEHEKKGGAPYYFFKGVLSRRDHESLVFASKSLSRVCHEGQF